MRRPIKKLAKSQMNLGSPLSRRDTANAEVRRVILATTRYAFQRNRSLHLNEDLVKALIPALLSCPLELYTAGKDLLEPILQYPDGFPDVGDPDDQDDLPEDELLDAPEWLRSSESAVVAGAHLHDPTYSHSGSSARANLTCPTDKEVLLADFRAKRHRVAKALRSSDGDDWLCRLLESEQPEDVALLDAMQKQLTRFVERGLQHLAATGFRNIELLSSSLKLEPLECVHLRLLWALVNGDISKDAFAQASQSGLDAAELLHAASLPSDGVAGAADSATSMPSAYRLLRSGVLEIRAYGQPSRHTDFEDLLHTTGIGRTVLATPASDLTSLSKLVFSALPSLPDNADLNWGKLTKTVQEAARMLERAARQGEIGVNILLYGPPGTGKTSCAQWLARQCGLAAFEVGSTSGDLAEQEGKRKDRLRDLLLSQSLLAEAHDSVLVLDEAEDVFPRNPFLFLLGGGDSDGEQGSGSKAWLNKLLETNRRPVVWIFNEIDHVHRAYLRRFTCVLEFPRPSYKLRQRFAEQYLGPLGVSADAIARAASFEDVSAGLLTTAARWAQLAAPASVNPYQAADHQRELDELVIGQLERSLKVMYRRVGVMDVRATTGYRTDLVNAQGPISLQQVEQALARASSGTLLLGGPPGTGKTQFAHHLAKLSDRSLVVRTAADINSMWFGEAERNVVRLFSEVDPTSQVLLIDEADSLLASRTEEGGRHYKAVTAEFLRHIERFQGILICATNHLEVLDAALMRRFMFRLTLKPLTAAQREDLLVSHLAQRGMGDINNPTASCGLRLTADQSFRLGRLDELTPGDFANVQRRFAALRSTAGVDEWIEALAQEQAAKGGGVNSIGFT